MILAPLRRIARAAARSRSLARWLFGIDFAPAQEGERYFDLTTPVLVHTLAARLTPSARLLDLGTGLFAVIGLSVWRRTGCQVVCSDRPGEVVERARQSVALNGAPLSVVASDLLEAFPEAEFDAIAFNPPYVPRAQVAEGERFVSQSDGGESGTEVIERFLDAFAQRGNRARAYLGCNALLVPQAAVRALIEARPGLRLREVVRRRPLPVDVFVLERSR